MFFIAIAVISIVISCKKSKSVVTTVNNTDTTKSDSTKSDTTSAFKALFVLSQGNFGSNNTTLTYYNFGSKTTTTDFFLDANGFGLGDTGSDMIIYGGKIYIVMNGSGYVAIANAQTAQLIDTISFTNGAVNRGPENVIAHGGKVFVSSTDNTVAVIDTATLSVIKNITVGANPAQMEISGNNLYVSNTGGFSINYDSTLSVIDLSSLTETGKIKVGINPGAIAADSSGNLYVACTGDYNTVQPSLVKVNATTNTVITSAAIAVGIVRYYNNKLFTTGGYLGLAAVQVIDISNLSVTSASFISDGTTVVTPYGLDIDPLTGDVYVGDAKDYSAAGTLFCFDKTGKKKFAVSVTPTASPIKTVFIQK